MHRYIDIDIHIHVDTYMNIDSDIYHIYIHTYICGVSRRLRREHGKRAQRYKSSLPTEEMLYIYIRMNRYIDVDVDT